MKQPTRLTDHSSTIIDIIASNKENIKRVIVIPTTFSDYDMVAGVSKLNRRKFPSRTIKCRDYSKYNHEKLKSDLRAANWKSVYDTTNVNKAVLSFNKILSTIFNKNAPYI